MSAITDDEAFSERLAFILKSLAHPARLRIVAALSAGKVGVGELAERLVLHQATVSHQLRILRSEGLGALGGLRDRRPGRAPAARIAQMPGEVPAGMIAGYAILNPGCFTMDIEKEFFMIVFSGDLDGT